MHTRLFVLIALAALTFAGGVSSETSTYVDGTLPGISPNTGGTLMLSDEKALSFRTGLATVSIAYANITHVELGATKETSHGVPAYKVWALHKRLGGKTQTQLLVVNFKSEAGEDRSMTLEVSKTSANGVLSTIRSRTIDQPAEKSVVASAEPGPQSAEQPKVATNVPSKSKKELKEEAKLEAKAAKQEVKEEKTAAKSDKPGDWWGDGYWKTSRNADKWNQKSPAPSTPNNNN